MDDLKNSRQNTEILKNRAKEMHSENNPMKDEITNKCVCFWADFLLF